MTTTITSANSIFSAASSPYNPIVSDGLDVLSGGSVIFSNNGVNSNGIAVDLDGVSQHYTVYCGGLIAGYGPANGAYHGAMGIYLASTCTANITIGSTGTVHGDDGAVWLLGSGSVLNYGIISSATTLGCALYSGSGSPASIDNKGQIVNSSGDAIKMNADVHSSISNSGLISAAAYSNAIVSWSAFSADVVTNSGEIIGNIELDGGNDLVRNTVGGHIVGQTHLRNGNDTYVGGGYDDIAFGDAGTDALSGGKGKDTLHGGAGADRITGGGGRDTLSGNLDSGVSDGVADIFLFSALADSGRSATARDYITDFARDTKDKIDVSGIDASTLAAGDQAFALLAIPGAAFTGRAGQLHYFLIDRAGTVNDRVIVEGDVNGDRIADFQIEVFGLKGLHKTDFIL